MTPIKYAITTQHFDLLADHIGKLPGVTSVAELKTEATFYRWLEVTFADDEDLQGKLAELRKIEAMLMEAMGE